MTLSGEVIILHITLTGLSKEVDKELWDYARYSENEMRSLMNYEVRKILGPEFDIRNLSFSYGSLEVIAAIGTTYYIVSRYKNFVESVELLTNQFKKMIPDFLTEYRTMLL